LNMIFDLTIAVDTRFTWSSFVTLNWHSLCSAFRRDLNICSASVT
jgi:hypothetical protein